MLHQHESDYDGILRINANDKNQLLQKNIILREQDKQFFLIFAVEALPTLIGES